MALHEIYLQILAGTSLFDVLSIGEAGQEIVLWEHFFSREKTFSVTLEQTMTYEFMLVFTSSVTPGSTK